MKTHKIKPMVYYLEVLVKWRKFIGKNVLIIVLVAAIISLIVPQKYTASATILPPSGEQSTMLGLLSASIPGDLAGLTGMAGVLPGVATPSDLYAAIMTSGSIKGSIIRKYDLKREFKVETMSDAVKALDGITSIQVTPEGLITVAVTYTDKYLAANIANSYLEELDKFNTETAMTVGKRYRLFIEERLNDNLDSLRYAEEMLRKFQEKHRTIALDIEVENAIETIADLKRQIILLEAKKGAIAASSKYENPNLYAINKELKELKKQLSKIEFGSNETDTTGKNQEFGIGSFVPFSKIPEVSLEYARLYRNVVVHETIYELLTQQYEQAKIMELKDTPTVQFLDRAGPPEKRSLPKRRVITFIALVLSLLASIFVVFVIDYYQTGGINEQTTNKLKNIFVAIRSDITHFLQKIKIKSTK